MGSIRRAFLVEDSKRLEATVAQHLRFPDSRHTAEIYFLTNMALTFGMGSTLQRYTFNGKLKYEGEVKLDHIKNEEGKFTIGDGAVLEWEKKPTWAWIESRMGPALLLSYDVETWDIYARKS